MDLNFFKLNHNTNFISPDLTKLTAIVDWAKPQDVLNLGLFLGITGHFQDLVKNYAKLEQPLCNLLVSVNLPSNYSKTTFSPNHGGLQTQTNVE